MINNKLVALDDLMLQAHSKNDQLALIDLYSQAGELSEDDGNIDAACFYYTHAMIFALELGDVRADDIRDKLIFFNREEV